MQIGDAQRCLGALLQPWKVFELWSALSEPVAQGTSIFKGNFRALFHCSALHNAFGVCQIVIFTLRVIYVLNLPFETFFIS